MNNNYWNELSSFPFTWVIQSRFKHSVDHVVLIINVMELYNWFVMAVYVYVQVLHHTELGFGMELNVVNIVLLRLIFKVKRI
jgi:hypothetical protein